MTQHQLVPTRPRPGARVSSLPPSPSALRPRALAASAHHGLLRCHGRRSAPSRLRSSERGQGTVEYVALAMLIAAIMVGVVSVAGGLNGGGIAQAVVEKVKAAIGAAGTVPKVKSKG